MACFSVALLLLFICDGNIRLGSKTASSFLLNKVMKVMFVFQA